MPQTKPLDETIEELERLELRASQPFWEVGSDQRGDLHIRINHGNGLTTKILTFEQCRDIDRIDAALICAMRNALPNLLAEMRRMQGEVESRRTEIETGTGREPGTRPKRRLRLSPESEYLQDLRDSVYYQIWRIREYRSLMESMPTETEVTRRWDEEVLHSMRHRLRIVHRRYKEAMARKDEIGRWTETQT